MGRVLTNLGHAPYGAREVLSGEMTFVSTNI
jgi:hypothetical protein